MSIDYADIRENNQALADPRVMRIVEGTLSELYEDQTHFILELLQNAEDALRKRADWRGSRTVHFKLRGDELTFGHYGKLFDEDDVRGICGLVETTKDVNDIGQFGLGFKSVYAYSDEPIIRSGREAFEIHQHVFPEPVPVGDHDPDHTLISLPLSVEDLQEAGEEITNGLASLTPTALLFLEHIKEISWEVDGGGSGVYRRGPVDSLGENVESVTLEDHGADHEDKTETWWVFSRQVAHDELDATFEVKIAFLTEADPETDSRRVRPLDKAPLTVFFPTTKETSLGYLMQGPYQTTPSRDTVPPSKDWNQRLAKETAALVVQALGWLRDEGLLTVETLQAVPLDREACISDPLLAPIFEMVSTALNREALLPDALGGYTAGQDALLAGTLELRELVQPEQLAVIFDHERPMGWVSQAISRGGTRDLWDYLTTEVGVSHVTPEKFATSLTKEFLEDQSDEWIQRLYQFLSNQSSLIKRGRFSDVPLIRLEDGTHVTAEEDGDPQAFLPSSFDTSFPTVCPAVCQETEAREFLEAMGLKVPDPVDDVIRHVLPRYHEEPNVDADAYMNDIERILAASHTDSKTRQDRLISALDEVPFVAVVDAGTGERSYARAEDAYLPTDRLGALFEGVEGILLVDDELPCLKGVDIRSLLTRAGVSRYLRPVEKRGSLSSDERKKLREASGHSKTSRRNDKVIDRDLVGVDALLDKLGSLPAQERIERARLLWEALSQLGERRGKGVFSGTYTWTHNGRYKQEFPASFLRTLNSTAWIPDEDGALRRPNVVLFEELEWPEDPLLAARVEFKPPQLEELAREAGFETEALDLLRERGLTDMETVRELIGEPEEDEGDGQEEEEVPAEASPGETGRHRREVTGRSSEDGTTTGSSGDRSTPGRRSTRQRRTSSKGGTETPSRGGGDEASSSRDDGPRPFISYIAVHPDEDPDREGTSAHRERMALEDKAIEAILEIEPGLQRTPPKNPGFDLYEEGEAGKKTRLIEVKAMSETLDEHAVGISRTQFKCGLEHGEAYWLYIVERAADPERRRIVRIQDPGGRARTFTFDRGWRAVADMEAP